MIDGQLKVTGEAKQNPDVVCSPAAANEREGGGGGASAHASDRMIAGLTMDQSASIAVWNGNVRNERRCPHIYYTLG